MAARKINLLPKEFTVSKEVSDASVKIKKYLWTSLGFYVVILAICGSFYYYFQTTLTNLESDQVRLKTNIQSLQETEQQLILTKDRIAKIQTVLASRQNEEVFNKQKTVVDQMTDAMNIENSNITISNSLLTFTSRSSLQLVSFMSSIASKSETLGIVMDSMSFNPFTGYTLGLEIY